MKRLLVALAAVVLTCNAAWAEILTGSCGSTATYMLDTESGLLKIEGTGAMQDYLDYTDAPWYANRSQIASIEVAGGITAIGSNAFVYCSNLTTIDMANTVTSIGAYAFLD